MVFGFGKNKNPKPVSEDKRNEMISYRYSVEAYLGDGIDNNTTKSSEVRTPGIECLFKEKDFEKALPYFEKALEIKKSSSNYDLKGLALKGMGKLEDALSCHEESLKLDPKSVLAYYYKANVLEALGKYEETLSCYDKIIQLDPDQTGGGLINEETAKKERYFDFTEKRQNIVSLIENSQGETDPLKVLESRLAKGEITQEEYESTKEKLE